MFGLLDFYVNSMEVSPSFQILLNLGLYVVKTAILIILGLVSTSILKRIIKKLTASWKRTLSARKCDTLELVLISVSRYTVTFIVACCILSVFSIPIQSILAVAGIGSIALGFGAQSLVQDFITGFFILLEDQFGVGDLVTLEGKTGVVESIGLRTTCIRSMDGDVHIFPNSQIRFVTNMSKDFKRAIVDVSISYDCNIDKALSSLRDEMELAKQSLPALLAVPSVLGVTELKESSMNIRILADCRIGESYQAERDLRRLIKIRFDKDGIPMPYPHVVVKEGLS